MNLADMLCYADIDQLTRIADTYRCECSSHSKNELIQTILMTVQRRDVLESRVDDMSENDLRFLNSLLFERRAAYSLEELTARAQTAAPEGEEAKGTEARTEPDKPKGRKRAARKQPEPPPQPESSARSAIARFKRFGWLFNGFSHQTRFLYHVPEDVKRRLCDALDQRYRMLLDIREEPPVYRDERGLAASDLKEFLRFVQRNDVPLTTEQAMYKRQIQQVLELMSVSEQLPGKSGWRFGYGRRFRDYPDRFSLLYDYGCYAGWIAELPERLELTEEGAKRAAGERPVDPLDLYRFWLRLYKGPVPNLISLVHWISRLAGEWTTVSSLGQILLPLIRPFYYDTPEDVLRSRVLAMMMHLGLLSWGETAEGEAVVRMTPQGRQMVTGSEVGFEDRLPWADAMAGEPSAVFGGFPPGS
ncbi:hypothetical protein [Cohnella zeiphila]|uniref:Uncharacterized protein n=1 Tax=Cohnella zeiphila TaxID=2761120 RepID=A0A7X0VZ77_9BACL|nr:hypothetical protein [Cohnella zeiphila]MBB6735445.1 hypothetical protein [Cohnella zeiphila]